LYGVFQYNRYCVLIIFIMKRIVYLSLLSIIFMSFISCKKKEIKEAAWHNPLTIGFIKIACDENFKTLMNAEINAFEAHSNYQAIITPTYTNETQAIRLLIEDSVNFALVTRDLNSRERAEFEKGSLRLQKHLIAFDGIALITNKSNPDSIIGLPTLEKILTGEIKEWSQVNSDSHLGTIRAIFDNKESGILRYAIDSIIGGVSLSPNIYALNNNLEVIEKVAEMPNAIGLIGFNALSSETNTASIELRNKIQLVRLSKEANATMQNSYLPYAGDIMQENYPLWRPVYVLLSDPKSGLASGLSVFLSHDVGQKVILQSGLLPVTAPQNRDVYIMNEYPK